jgi:hypothetical protein
MELAHFSAVFVSYRMRQCFHPEEHNVESAPLLNKSFTKWLIMLLEKNCVYYADHI